MRCNSNSAKKRCSQTNPKNPHTKRVVAETPLTPPLETCGELFSDGKCIELVRDSETGSPQLIAFDGEKLTRGACIELGGQRYVPSKLAPSILRALTLPTDCIEYRTTDELFRAIEETLIENGIPEDVALPLTYFTLAASFTDCLPAAPCLLLTGPRVEASFVFRLLGCLVRHPMPLIGVSVASFRSAPFCLQPTFLINQEFPPSMVRFLTATNNPNAWLPSKDGLVNGYSAKAIYGGITASEALLGAGVLHVNLLLSRGKLPVLDSRAEKAIADQIQPMLLMYRARNAAKVRISDFDLPEFASGIRILARVLGAPLVDAPALRAGLRPVLQAQQEQIRAQRWLDERGAVIEAALAFCHREYEDRAYVGAIAATATHILKGRGENVLLEPKAVGAMLRSAFGIFPKRDAQGSAVRLTEDIRRKIHGLGQIFEVASFEARETRCQQCIEVFAAAGCGEPGKEL